MDIGSITRASSHVCSLHHTRLSSISHSSFILLCLRTRSEMNRVSEDPYVDRSAARTSYSTALHINAMK